MTVPLGIGVTLSLCRSSKVPEVPFPIKVKEYEGHPPVDATVTVYESCAW